MKFFRDNSGREWQVSVTIGTMKRVRALCDVDLYKIIEVDKNGKPNAELLERLSTDPVLLVDVLYAVCKPEADKLGVSDFDFGEALTGDTIEAAANALLDELVDFFPEAKRQVFQKVLQATRRFKAATEKQLTAILTDPELDARLESELKKLLDSSGSTPGSSASTPTA
jgi:uncharacterized protein (DUF1778 family)